MKKKITILATFILMLAFMAVVAGCSGEKTSESPPESVVTDATSETPGAVEDDNDTEELQAESDYIAAKALLESGDYAAAVEAFAALGDYKDSAALAANGHLYQYVGTYRSNTAKSVAITITEDGQLQFRDGDWGGDVGINNIRDDGSILALEVDNDGVYTSTMSIYPVGIPLDVYNNDTFEFVASDDNKLRVFITHSDVPDINNSVYYKAEPLPADALSYLPEQNTVYEFGADGVISANGQEWGSFYVMGHTAIDGGEIEEKIISAAQDGGQVDLKYVDRDYIYYEDATGMYGCKTNTYPIAVSELRIKYPLTVGETFQSSDFYGTGTIEAINESVTTAAGVFENVVVISYEYGEGGYGEKQYFAPGVGLIKYEAVRSNGELVAISK